MNILSESTTDVPLKVVYQDEHIVVIDKPAGLLVHRSAIDRHETRFALQMLRDQIGQTVYPVHRLDKPTSGLLVFALSRDCARQLVAQFTQRETTKTYLAIVRGWPPESDRIDYPLPEMLDKMTDRQAAEGKAAQEAVTSYRRLATVELPFPVTRYPTSRYALLEIQPETGRKHQIRRHLHHVFHPVIGDTTHGEGRHNRFFREQYNVSRLLLAAVRLAFKHPVSGDNMQLATLPGDDFARLSAQFKWDIDFMGNHAEST